MPRKARGLVDPKDLDMLISVANIGEEEAKRLRKANAAASEPQEEAQPAPTVTRGHGSPGPLVLPSSL